MGCGVSTQLSPEDDDQYLQPQPRSPVHDLSADDGGPRLVVDMYGHTAYVQVHDNSWYDLTAFNAARESASLAERAAEVGALRSVLKLPEYSGNLEALRTQKRVLRLSLQSADESSVAVQSGGTELRAVRLKIAPT